jgi:ATP-binding cassette subfamily F protein uup
VAPSPTTTTRPLSYKERRELTELEERIPQLEAERDQVATALSSVGADYQRVATLSQQLAQCEATIEAAFTRWAELSERV